MFLSPIVMAFTKFILLIAVYMCIRCVLGTAHMWRSEDDFVTLVPFFFLYGLLCLLSHLASLRFSKHMVRG